MIISKNTSSLFLEVWYRNMSPLLKTSTLCSAVHLVFSVDQSCATSYFQGAVPCSLLPVHTTTTERFISCSCRTPISAARKKCTSPKISLVNRTLKLIKTAVSFFISREFLRKLACALWIMIYWVFMLWVSYNGYDKSFAQKCRKLGIAKGCMTACNWCY